MYGDRSSYVKQLVKQAWEGYKDAFFCEKRDMQTHEVAGVLVGAFRAHCEVASFYGLPVLELPLTQDEKSFRELTESYVSGNLEAITLTPFVRRLLGVQPRGKKLLLSEVLDFQRGIFVASDEEIVKALEIAKPKLVELLL